MTPTIIHISDTHFGQSGTSINHADDLDMLQRVIDHAKESRADAIVHTGDLFHRHDPPQTVVDDVCAALDPEHRYVRGYDDYCIPFYYIRGDYGHDVNDNTTTTPGLDELARINFVEMMYPPAVQTVGANQEVALLGVPAHMNPHFDDAQSVDALSFGLRKNCKFVIECAHLTLTNINTGGYLSGKRQYTARDVLATIDVQDGPGNTAADIDLLACGDLHSYKEGRLLIPPSVHGTKVVYAGSLTGRYNGPKPQDGYGAKYQISGSQCEITKLNRH